LTRYRTPRKKTTNWKGHLAAFAIGAVCLTLGLFLLLQAPEEPAGTEPAAAEPASAATEAGVPEDPAQEEPAPADPTRGPRPDASASAELARSFFGLALVVLGVALPVASIVIEKTSGKKWNRRAGKKHPFKRKI
jgi:hypothetical protein